MTNSVKIHLAPMEGVVDALLRKMWTAIGGFDQCYTEFIRVTDQLIPDKVFYRDCPELQHQARTPSGTPVRIQLLGGDPICLAENAARAVELGSFGVDLNFGCPAPTVNRHDGGATLLQYPERIFDIVEKVRQAVPRAYPVTVKIRLGFMNTDRCLDNAQAIESAGASHLTVHCRTKKQMYQPPVDWSWIPRIETITRLPLVVNGDISSIEDFRRCQQETRCREIMIGRGALSNPWLAQEILQMQNLPRTYGDLVLRFFDLNVEKVSPAFAVARTKQLFRYFLPQWPEGRVHFEHLKVLRDPSTFRQYLAELCSPRPSLPHEDARV